MKNLFLIVLLLVMSPPLVKAQEDFKVNCPETHLSDWKVKVFKGQADYRLRNTPKPMIVLSTENSNYMLVREFKDFDLLQYPCLTFEWMVEKHPLNGDLRKRATDDQAAGLYVVLPFFPELVNFRAIGYVWDNGAPLGVYPSPSSSNIKYLVLRSGAAGLGRWHTEHRNILEDFKAIWGIEVSGKRKVVVSLAADSDGTKSSTLASFGTIRFLIK